MKKKMLTALFATIMLLSGCSFNEEEKDEKDIENTAEPFQTVEKEEISRIIDLAEEPIDVSGWEPMGKYECDVLNNSKQQTITLYTSAQRDKKGDMMWDDTQQWVLKVETEDGEYDLYSERIHGYAYMGVYDYYGDEDEDKVITLYAETNSGNRIINYVFNEEGQFEERLVYSDNDYATSGTSMLYTSIPEYE